MQTIIVVSQWQLMQSDYSSIERVEERKRWAKKNGIIQEGVHFATLRDREIGGWTFATDVYREGKRDERNGRWR